MLKLGATGDKGVLGDVGPTGNTGKNKIFKWKKKIWFQEI